MAEPYRLRRWRPRPPLSGELFTCARPGRSKGANQPVPDDIVHKWLRGLPGGTEITIVSLLGRKNGPQGRSEFSFYSFYGKWDKPAEQRGRMPLQHWIERRHKDRSIIVVEYPTYDFQPIPEEVLAAIASDILKLISAGRIVVLVDSGGQTRTSEVCKYIGFVEDSTSQQDV